MHNFFWYLSAALHPTPHYFQYICFPWPNIFMVFWKSAHAMGRRARQCCQYWSFKNNNPKFDSSKDKRWEQFESWCHHIAPNQSHQHFQNVPCPILGICTWLPTSRCEFWDFTVLLDTKIIPSNGMLFKINFLCGFYLNAASIWAKNELLTL